MERVEKGQKGEVKRKRGGQGGKYKRDNDCLHDRQKRGLK